MYRALVQTKIRQSNQTDKSKVTIKSDKTINEKVLSIKPMSYFFFYFFLVFIGCSILSFVSDGWVRNLIYVGELFPVLKYIGGMFSMMFIISNILGFFSFIITKLIKKTAHFRLHQFWITTLYFLWMFF